MEFQIRTGLGPQPWYWVIVSGNHQVLATSEMYRERRDAVSAANAVRSQAARAPQVF